MHIYLSIGASCRARVLTVLCKKFKSPQAAEKHYQVSSVHATSAPAISEPVVTTSNVSMLQVQTVPSPAKTTTTQTSTTAVVLPPMSLPHTVPPPLPPLVLRPMSSPGLSTMPSSSVSVQPRLPTTLPSILTASSTRSQLPVINPLMTTRSQPSLLVNNTPVSSTRSALTVGDVLTAFARVPTDNPQPSESQIELACWEQLEILPSHQQCSVLSKLFSKFLKQNSSIGSLPGDFLELALKGMVHLKNCNRSNVIYLLVKALGTMRPNQSDSLLPSKRMPMGLIEYAVMFFTSSSTRQVLCILLLCYFILFLIGGLPFRL